MLYSHTFYHSYLIVTQTLFMCFKSKASSVTHHEQLYSVTTLLGNFSILNIGVKSLIRNKAIAFHQKSLLLSQIDIPGELVFLNRGKNQLQSCISLLIIKFIYLITFRLILILKMYAILFFPKFLFHKPFITFQTQTSLSCISSSRTNNCRARLLPSFFFSKNSSILYNFSLLTTYILLLYIPKCFAYHFYTSQVLTFENFNKTKKQVIEMSHQDFLIGKHKNIFHNLRKHTFFIA